MKTCKTCGKPINTGGASGGATVRCLICRTGDAMRTFYTPARGGCVCGCGRRSDYGRRGLSIACYFRLRRAGGAALIDRLFPKERGRG